MDPNHFAVDSSIATKVLASELWTRSEGSEPR